MHFFSECNSRTILSIFGLFPIMLIFCTLPQASFLLTQKRTYSNLKCVVQTTIPVGRELVSILKRCDSAKKTSTFLENLMCFWRTRFENVLPKSGQTIHLNSYLSWKYWFLKPGMVMYLLVWPQTMWAERTMYKSL